MTPAVLAVRNAVGAITFEETFSVPCGPKDDFAALYPRFKRRFYFGNEGDMTSRAYPGTRNVMLDNRFAPDVFPPPLQAPNGYLYIYANKMQPAQIKKYGVGGRDHASGMISTQDCFSQAFGYFEISAKLPDCSGAWPAFWLLPVEKTAANDGRLAEIDVMEHWGGLISVQSGGKTVQIDRRGRPLSTLHYGVHEAEKVASNGAKMPDKIDLGKFHTFGCLWTPDFLSFFIDQVQTLMIPNPGVIDPHYMVVSMDVSDGAGDPAFGKYPAPFIIDYIRAWALK